MLTTLHDLAGFQGVHSALRTGWCTNDIHCTVGNALQRALRTAWCITGTHNTEKLHCSQMQEITAQDLRRSAYLEDWQVVVARGHVPARAGLEQGQGSPAHRGCCAAARNDCAYVYDQAQSAIIPHVLNNNHKFHLTCQIDNPVPDPTDNLSSLTTLFQNPSDNSSV